MSTQYAFSKIVTNGLVLSLDAADQNSFVSGSLTWNDLSGNNFSGSLLNGTNFSTNNLGSITFDSVNDIITVANASQLAITGDITILSWVNRPDNGRDHGILAKAISNLAAPYEFYIGGGGDPESTGSLKFYRGNGSTFGYIYGTTTVPTGSWQHVSATMSGTSVNLYLNASSIKTGTITTTIGDNSNSASIGARLDFGNALKGNMALIQVYNRALSASEILQNYNAQRARFGL